MFLVSRFRSLFEKLFGYHTKRKIICFESDDWGTVRMPSNEVLKKINSFDPSTNENPFLTNDTLESENDIKNLCDVLKKHKDLKGNHPSFTFYYVPFNPDFETLRADKNSPFVFETVEKTYERYFSNDNVLKSLKKAVEQRLIDIQFHAAWHVNERRWLCDARKNKKGADIALDNGVCGGIGISFTKDNIFGYMDTFNYDKKEELSDISNNIKIGTKRVNELFNIKAQGIACPCFVWDDCVEQLIKSNEYKYISCICWQYDCHKRIGTNGKRKMRFLGHINKKTKIMYITRNCNFEVSENSKKCVEDVIKQIEKCFKFKNPAVINTHRMNYVSGVNPQNAKNGLCALDELLQKIIQKYPDVEFLTSNELAKTIMEQYEK